MTADYLPPGVPPMSERPVRNTIVLADVDGTLTPAVQQVSPEMCETLRKLREKVVIGFVGGSDLKKQENQLGQPKEMFDFCFAENGLVAYRLGKELPSQSFIKKLGEERYRRLSRFILTYIAERCIGPDDGSSPYPEDRIPVVRGTHIEFRRGMINVSPIGRNATIQERKDFNKFDIEHGVRKRFVEAIQKEFPDYDLSIVIGGEISFDITFKGWDKTYCLQLLEAEAARPGGVKFDKIIFFGDKCYPGGNDYSIYSDPRTTGYAVTGPEDTMARMNELFFSK